MLQTKDGDKLDEVIESTTRELTDDESEKMGPLHLRDRSDEESVETTVATLKRKSGESSGKLAEGDADEVIERFDNYTSDEDKSSQTLDDPVPKRKKMVNHCKKNPLNIKCKFEIRC